MLELKLNEALPDSWACIDCRINTAPGFMNRLQSKNWMAANWNNKGFTVTVNSDSEIYMVKPKVWKAAGMAYRSGCLCIGCLEARLKRLLKATDFERNHPSHWFPGTERLLERRGNAWMPPDNDNDR